tara:strand:- start:255 stop:2900 length:2646 start_codon:yes stop_codon:yes gene_type:complete
MNKKPLADIRSEFLSFFKKSNHKIVQSSNLVPVNDDSLLFTNAGMVQFKNIFTGIETHPETKRAVSAQKCVRAGGKHNDLENVGLTKRHHTFFEMLGNFSFGDYFKEEAIEMAWTLITKNFQINKDRIIITVYESDEEAFKLWKKISSFSDNRILKIGGSDNFWEMGDTGPCGPCSEIFYDHGSNHKGGLPGTDNEGDRFVEIWNLVFMQYNKSKNGDRKLLPKPSIDTGMGIERVAAVLQGKADNYEIDLFRSLIDKIKDVFKIPEDQTSKVPLRIISDHLRSVSFLISDGVLPSNEGRGYVLRRILRRAIRHIYNLNIKEPIFYKLIPIIIEEMGTYYKELSIYKELISKTVETEENKFLETLEKGLKMLENENRKSTDRKIFSGKVAFKLYDTFGFPIDLTADVLKSNNKKIDMIEFEHEMKLQKELSKKSWKGDLDDSIKIVWKELLDNLEETTFVGYENLILSTNVSKILWKNKELTSFSKVGEKFSLFFKKTPFYSEGGGQIGDQGIIESDDFQLEVLDTQKRLGRYYEHICILRKGIVSKDQKAVLKVEETRRNKITAHHSATHLLHSSLRKILGKHVTQKGSLVTEKKIRFDISHNQQIDADTIVKLEIEINKQIQENHKVVKNILEKNEAIERGAIAIFGEKYGKKVRVIEMGKDTLNREKSHSVELCGGTHVQNTGEIGTFKIINEGSLASGIRRIEAVAGTQAIEIYQDIEKNLRLISNLLKTQDTFIVDKVENLLKEKKELEKKIKINSNPTIQNLKKININDCNFYSSIFQDLDTKTLKNIIDDYKRKDNKSIITLISKGINKVSIVIGVTEDMSKRYDAKVLLNQVIPILGGKGGGGRITLAQGGGNRPKNAAQALDKILDYIKNVK